MQSAIFNHIISFIYCLFVCKKNNTINYAKDQYDSYIHSQEMWNLTIHNFDLLNISPTLASKYLPLICANCYE